MHQTFFKIGTGFLLLVLMGMLGWQAQQRSDITASAIDPELTETANTAKNGNASSLGSDLKAAGEDALKETGATESGDAESDASLRVGVIGATPSRSEVTLLKEVPANESVTRRAYINARDRSCRMLVPGASVSPPLSTSFRDRRGTLGRKTVLTIGLELDEKRQKRMPSVTRGQILDLLQRAPSRGSADHLPRPTRASLFWHGLPGSVFPIGSSLNDGRL